MPRKQPAENKAGSPLHVTPPRDVPKPKTAVQRKQRLERILTALDSLYPDATCALHHRNAWELLVATILSAQCTDKRVNEVTPGLFAKYPTVEDFANAPQEQLANDIRSTGFFNNKAKSVIGAARRILTEFGGQVPRTMEEIAHRTRRCPQDFQRGIGNGIRHRQRGSGGYARAARRRPSRSNQE